MFFEYIDNIELDLDKK